MTTYMDLDNCQVVCSCWRTKPLCFLYFCRYCLELRCGDCVSHEVDSHYCPNCLENMASAEAKMRKHKCSNCFDCPSCGHSLSARATAVLLAKPDEPGKTTAQKAYYLTCGFCRWSTRDSGITDQRQALGGWQETPNPHVDRISALMEGYHHLAVKEKANLHLSRHFSRPPMTRNYMLLLERYPVLNPHLRRTYGSSWMTPTKEADDGKSVSVPAAEAPSPPGPFDVSVFTKEPLQLDKVTTIHQRHLAPTLQPTRTGQLEPHAKSLVVKRSMRCRACEHNLSKADFNPSSIKFRINLTAYHHVPELRYILKSGPDSTVIPTGSNPGVPASGDLNRRTSVNLAGFRKPVVVHRDYAPGKTQHLVLTVCNPAHSPTSVSLRQLTADEEVDLMSQVRATGCHTPGDVGRGWSLESTACSAGPRAKACVDSAGDSRRQKPVGSTEDGGGASWFSTVKLHLPTAKIDIARRNDVADFADLSSTQADPADDPKVIAFRRGNKIGIHMGVTPLGNVKVAPSSQQVTEVLSPIPESPAVASVESAVFPTPDDPPHNADTVPLRAAIRLAFEYKSTTTAALANAPSAAAVAAGHLISVPSTPSEVKVIETPAGEANKPGGGGVAPGSEHRVDTIEINWLIYFGEMAQA